MRWVVVLLVSLFFVAANDCSRKLSREARKRLRDLETTTLGTSFEYPRDCPFHPELDRFAVHEASKGRDQMNWKCQVCKKVFRDEDWLDQHFERKHLDLVPANATVCLSDYCGVLRCPSLPQGDECVPTLKTKERMLCNMLINQCVPVASKAALHDKLVSELCDVMSCDHAKASVEPDVFVPARRPWWYVLAALLLVGLAVFYLMVYLHHTELRPKKDLGSRKSSWCGRKEKKAKLF